MTTAIEYSKLSPGNECPMCDREIKTTREVMEEPPRDLCWFKSYEVEMDGLMSELSCDYIRIIHKS